MKIKHCVNGIELTKNDETIFISSEHMITEKQITKTRVDEFAGEDRSKAYMAIARHLKALVDMADRLEKEDA
ncbi:hypothetical protein [Citrobacter phage Ci1]|nr:hypothetical protein [Citrobacter phage Ci1]